MIYLLAFLSGFVVGGLLVAGVVAALERDSGPKGYVDLTGYHVRSLKDMSVPEGTPGHVRTTISFEDPDASK